MATTATIGILAAGGFAALAGAIGLGIAGIASASHQAKRRRGRPSYYRKMGDGEKDKEGEEKKEMKIDNSAKGPGGFGLRHDRAAPVGGAEGEEVVVERILRVVREDDFSGCGLRLVCELAEEPEEELAEEELAILNFIGPLARPGEGFLPSGAATGEYKAAKALGLANGDCAKAFPLCPFNGSQIMETVSGYLI